MSYKYRHNDTIITFKNDVDYYRALKNYAEYQILLINSGHTPGQSCFLEYLKQNIIYYNMVTNTIVTGKDRFAYMCSPEFFSYCNSPYDICNICTNREFINEIDLKNNDSNNRFKLMDLD